MKNIARPFMWTALLCALLFELNANPDQLFQEANNAFKNEHFLEAIDIYESIIESGTFSQDLFANLGTAHLKAGHTAEAILNFEKSLLINPENATARENLVLARERIIDPISIIPDFILTEIWRSFVASLNPSGWLYWHAFFLILSLVVLAVVWVDSANKLFAFIHNSRLSPYLFFILLAVSFFLLYVSMQRVGQIENINYGIVMEDKSSLRNGPDERSPEMTTISGGSKILVLDQLENWYKVQLEDKDEGWMQKSSVELVRIKQQ